MAQTQVVPGFLLRHDFVLRRLHSLAGLVPLTLFFFEHMFTNMKATQGPAAFHSAIDFLTGLPALYVIEAGFILLPLAFHGLYGVLIYFSGQGNLVRYRYRENWRYSFQRWTGLFVLLFVTHHVLRWRFGVLFPWQDGGPGLVTYNTVTGSPQSFYEALHVTMAQPSIFILYVAGLAATAYHLANGLWTFAITWGITRSQRAQKAWSKACALVGVLLFVAGTLSLIALATSQRIGIIQHDQPDHSMEVPTLSQPEVLSMPTAESSANPPRS